MLLLSNMVDRLRSFDHLPFSVVSLTHKNCGLIFRFAKPLIAKWSAKILRLKVAKLWLNFGILSQNCDWNFSLILSPDIHDKFCQTLTWTKLSVFSINLLVVYRESVNLIGYITRRLSADSLQLWIANENRSPIYFDQSRRFKFQIVHHKF